MSRTAVIRCHYFRDTRLQREVSALLDAGHSVHVVCLRDEGEPLRERNEGLTITRMPMRHPAGEGVARRLFEYLAFFVVAGAIVTVLHLRRRFDLVQVNSVPDALVFAAWLPKLTGARVLLDLQEPLPEFLMTKAAVDEHHPAVRMVMALEQASIRFADAVVTPSEPMRQRFITRGADADKITVVMDGADEAVFDAGRFPGRPERGDDFVLISHGTIEPQYGLETVIRAVARLADDIPALKLQIVGDGSQRAELQTLSQQLGVSDRVQFTTGFLPLDELVSTLARADVGVVAMMRDRFRDLTLAGKMFDYINMDIPMIVSATRSVEQAFPPGCFESFVSGDVEDLAAAVKRVYADSELAASYARRAKDAAKPYCWPVQRRRYQSVVVALVGDDHAAARSGSPLPVTVVRSPDAATLSEWDDLVRRVPDSDVAQLSDWADIRRAAGFEPSYLFVHDGGELVAGALVLTRRLPLVGRIGYLPYGPVIAPEAERDPAIAAVVTALQRLSEREIRTLFVQPPAGGEDISREFLRRGFRPSRAGIAPTATLRVDLSRSEDELFAGLSKDMRKKSRRWPKNDVRVRYGGREDVALLARLHAATGQHQNFSPIPVDYIDNLYGRLAPLGHAVLLVGEVAGRPVCATLLTGCGGVLKARLTGTERDPDLSRLGVAAAVMWEAIRSEKRNGYRWFDFGGITDEGASILEAETPDLTALSGAEFFKAGFGGKPFRYPTPVEVISSPLLRGAYDASLRWPASRRAVERAAHALRAGPRFGPR